MNYLEPLLDRLLMEGVRFSIKDSQVAISSSTGKLTKEQKRIILEHKNEIKSYLINEAKKRHKSIELVAPAARYALSSAQCRLWVLSRFEEGSVAYNMPGAYGLEGDLDVDALSRAVLSLVERHESLRTRFESDEEGLWQVVDEVCDFAVGQKDLRGEEDPLSAALNLALEEVKYLFDLSNGPLLRVCVLRLEESKWVLLLNMHHIVSDGWSMGVLVRDLLSLYDSYRLGYEPSLEPLRIQYKDYAGWQNGLLEGRLLEEGEAYWRGKLSGVESLKLPYDYSRPRIKTYNGGVVSYEIGSEDVSELKAILSEGGSTLYMGLLCLVKILLWRYSGQEDIVVGSPVSGREHVDLKDQIGFYVNTVALRDRVRGESRLVEFLGEVKATVLEALKYQDYPFDVLVEELGLDRDMSRSALFDVMVTLNEGFGDPEGLEGLKISALSSELVTSKFDLTYGFEESGEGLNCWIEYNSDLFDRGTIERWADHFRVLVSRVVKRGLEQNVGEVEIIPSGERHRLLEEFNDTGAEYPKDKCVHELFEEHARREPEKVALVFEGEEMSYGELNDRSNRLARKLREEYGVGPDVLVGMLVERSFEMVVGILGILKAGGAYVPMDPGYPSERLRFMQSDSGCKVMLHNVELDADVLVEGVALLDLRDDSSYSEDGSSLSVLNKGSDLIYCIYTSGSTGKPKGVLVEHRNVVNLVKSANYVNWIENDVILQTGSISFDAITFELWGALLNGLQLVLINEDEILDTENLGLVMRDANVTTMWLTSALFDLHVEKDPFIFKSLRQLLVGGDVVHVESVLKTYELNPSLSIINGYGPTETTTFSVCGAISRNLANVIPIGCPISNTQVYILGLDDVLCPIGVTGELCISGAGLGRGYLNRDELTNEKFVSNPFVVGERMYRTGDLARWLPDGNLEFLGRMDDQVKVRGYRIELGEVEFALLGLAGVSQAVVIVDGEESEKSLVAYYVSLEDLSISDLRRELSRSLPEYMVPSYYVCLESLPLTANGKVDRKRLPRPDMDQLSGDEYVAPRDEFEQKLCEIWSEVLKVERVGIEDNFFNLGGDSLKAITVVRRMAQKLGMTISIVELVTGTVKSLSSNRIK